jgi:hypothetical protein
MLPFGRAMHPTQNVQSPTYNYAWARKDEKGNIVVLVPLRMSRRDQGQAS